MSFSTIRRMWGFNPRNKKEVKWSKEAYTTHIVSDELHQELVKLIQNYNASLGEGQPPHIPLWKFISEAFVNGEIPVAPKQASEPVVVVPEISASNPERTEVGFADKLFEELWDWWSEEMTNDGRREFKRTAHEAWREAVKEFAPEDIVLAAKHYRDKFHSPASKMAYPVLFKTFVSPKDDYCLLQDWIHRAKYAPKPIEVEGFNKAYSQYPYVSESEEEKEKCMALWRRFIAPEDRLDFYWACMTYRTERRRIGRDNGHEEAAKYTMSFSTFIAEWRSVKYAYTASRGLGKHYYRAAVDLGLDTCGHYSDGRPHGGQYVHMYLGAINVGIKKYNHSIKGAMRWMVKKYFDREGIEEICEELIKKTLQKADLMCYI